MAIVSEKQSAQESYAGGFFFGSLSSALVGRDSVEPSKRSWSQSQEWKGSTESRPTNFRFQSFHGPTQPALESEPFTCCGVDEPSAMAGDGGDAPIGLAGGRAIQEMAPLGLLVFPAQQRSLGGLGMVRQRLGAHSSAIWPRRLEHPRRSKERLKKDAAIAGRV